MSINDLSKRLDDIITAYDEQAGSACQFCSTLSDGDALSKSHDATSKALASFKAEILTYLSQL